MSCAAQHKLPVSSIVAEAPVTDGRKAHGMFDGSPARSATTGVKGA